MSNTITSTLIWRKLQILVNNGTTAGGTNKTIGKYFSNINPDATITQLKAAADALSGLMDTSVAGVYDLNKSLLSEIQAGDGGGAQ